MTPSASVSNNDISIVTSVRGDRLPALTSFDLLTILGLVHSGLGIILSVDQLIKKLLSVVVVGNRLHDGTIKLVHARLFSLDF